MIWPYQPLLAASAHQQADLADALPADAGLFGIAGGNTALRLGRRLPAAPGSFAAAGDGALMVRSRALAADAGSFQITGGDIPTGSGPRWCELGLSLGV